MNILITSVGKRVTLVKEFQQELKCIIEGGKVLTVDFNPSMAPAALISDGYFKVPRVTSEKYIGELIRICLENNVKVIIPTIDTELIILASHKKLFANYGIDVLVSDMDFIMTCRDKRNTINFFDEYHIKYPSHIDPFNPVFPIFAKPYDGSLSQDIHIIRQPGELTEELLSNQKLMFMEYIDKTIYKEFTVDMYYGRDYHLKSIVPRERIEIRAGEINKGITRKNYLVDFLFERLNYIKGVIGCICIQLFYNDKTNDVLAIEINPRFGGGYPLSYYAGANYPAYVIKEYLKNEELEYQDNWLDNTLMLRYDNEVIIYEEKSRNF